MSSSIAKPRIQHQPWCDTTDHESDGVREMYGSPASIGCGTHYTEVRLSGGGSISGYARAWEPGGEPVAQVDFFQPPPVLTMADVQAIIKFFEGLMVTNQPRIPQPRTGD